MYEFVSIENESSSAIVPKAPIPSHVTNDSSEARTRKRSYTDSVNLNSKTSSDSNNLNDVKKHGLYDLSDVLLRSVGEKPNEHLFYAYYIVII